MPKQRTYTDQQVIDAVIISTSIRQVLSRIGLIEAGGNYRSIKLLIKKLNLDTSHFTGKVHNKGKIIGPKRPLEDYLSNVQTITSYKLKLRLLQDGIFENRCSNCLLERWLDNPIPLELHHINGNHQDNSLINLQLLCPNCHALTNNYRFRSKGPAKIY